MTGARITYTLNDDAYRAALTKLGGVLHTGVLKTIGVALVETTQHRFETQTEPLGARWAPLNPAYAAIKRGPGILRASGLLQRLITSEVRGHTVTVGSNRVYAAIHQFGGVITPKNGKALAFRMGGSKKGKPNLVLAKSVRIPARPYLGFGPADQRAVMDVLDSAIRGAFRS